MKRSEINTIIGQAIDFMSNCQFHLPEWAYWDIQTWRKRETECQEIFANNLGWDITDFGSGNFAERGLTLFTIRNGNLTKKEKPYCEKIMIVREEQETPFHRHWSKSEDIINRGGGNLILELYLADLHDNFSEKPFEVSIDGLNQRIIPGEQLVLSPGQSIFLKSEIFHKFYGEVGKGSVLVGEISTVNDDKNDNCFHEGIGRFPEIEEDTPPKYLLVSDYSKFINSL